MVRDLERFYGGREISNAAATILQRAYRAKRLQNQFSKLLTLALSSDRVDKRLSLLGPDFDAEMSQKKLVPVPTNSQSPMQKAEAEIDRLIMEAAGLMRSVKSGPSVRHIKNRRANAASIKRSASMVTKVRSNPSLASASRDDLDLPSCSPVPPCPPLRGEDFYADSIYVTRDSLYAQEPRNPPKPPQRTVSFLAHGTLPRKVSYVQKHSIEEVENARS